MEGETISKEVLIVPSKKYPFKILKCSSEKSDNIEIFLEESDNNYKLKLVNKTDKPGRLRDVIKIKTDSKIKSEIDIPVYINIQNRVSKNKNINQNEKSP